MPTSIKKILVANRSEIAIRILRAASELKIRTVSIYTYEDRFSPHRYKADESYQIGEDDDPLKPYLDIEGIIDIALAHEVDAIHPGYGFLSENVSFAERCRANDIIFIGPSADAMRSLGDKVIAKQTAVNAGVPVIEDSNGDLLDVETALSEANRIGYPVMLKAASGGGGRGMRVIQSDEELQTAWDNARSEALNAFGDDTVFLEKYIDSPKHIEVQILGDQAGNIVHLYERDCSIQRRFQKVVEVAPAHTLAQATRDSLYQYALDICHSVGYYNAGTVEFLVDKQNQVYFIEVNPRIQVEHTITEQVTGIDLVRSQILLAAGYQLSDPQINLPAQEDIPLRGHAIQCRITTEDPENDFQPDFGTINAYRSAAGFGIRLDVGAAYPGAQVSPFFDSMLVKITASGRTFKETISRADRALREFRIRGVKTNIGYLENVLAHPEFASGQANVGFIAAYPELFELPPRMDRATNLLQYLGDVHINGHPEAKTGRPANLRVPQVPEYDHHAPIAKGSKDRLTELGAEAFCQEVRDTKHILYTDTTFRDAHQSLLATRMRTKDMLKVATGVAHHHPQLFSMEMWGGATFDVALRFLHEDPWHRLQVLREAMPNILFQMLFRGSNAVGYKAYPDNVIEKFIEASWENGIDVFRIFDSLNWVEGMTESIKTVRNRTGGIAEATVCYTGDVLNTDPSNRYTIGYYIDLAKRLEDAGAHMLALKDMAGLLKPYAAAELIPALREAVALPIHLHTHDTSSIQSATLLKAIEAEVDVVDACVSSMSGLTSQPSLNGMIAAMQGQEREQPFDLPMLNQYANYWEDVREIYAPFESGLKAGTTEVYEHEIPGGQYSNLRPQAISLGLGHKFEKIKQNYYEVNQLFGDIVKVTPSSKVVGDMALFMTANDLSAADVLAEDANLAFPQSVIDLFKGRLGQVEGGFPEQLSQLILKGEKPLRGRPGDDLPPVDFNREFVVFQEQFDPSLTELDFLSYLMYPDVFQDYYDHIAEFGTLWYLPTTAFFYGLDLDEEILVKIGQGKSIDIRLVHQGEPDANGNCQVSFDLNGQLRSLRIKDKSVMPAEAAHRKADAKNEIGAPLQGKLSKIMVADGESVEAGQALFVIEAMKMETTVSAPQAGTVAELPLKEGCLLQQDDLIVVLDF